MDQHGCALTSLSHDHRTRSAEARLLLLLGTEAMAESENREQDSSCVGTPDYLAPEIFLSSGHGASSHLGPVDRQLTKMAVVGTRA